MSTEAILCAALASAVANQIPAIRDAVTEYKAATPTLTGEDVEADMREILPLLLAAEKFEEAGKQAAQQLRAALTHAMAESGCPGFYTEHHHVTTAAKPGRVVISDETRIPPDLLSDPKPDSTKIGKAIREGREVPGATIASNGEPSLRISPIKKKAKAA